MPVYQEIVGTGITKRTRQHISAPYGEEEVAALRRMAEDFNSNTLENYLAPWEGFCQGLLAKAQLPPWGKVVYVDADGTWTENIPKDWQKNSQPGAQIASTNALVESRYGIDSPLWFACAILAAIDRVRRHLARDDGTLATAAGIELGQITTIATFKFRWEPEIAFAKKTRENRRKANTASIKTRSGMKQETLNAVRSHALDLWRKEPAMSLTQTAHIITKDLHLPDRTEPLNVHTVRGYLKNREAWSPLHPPKAKKTDHS